VNFSAAMAPRACLRSSTALFVPQFLHAGSSGVAGALQAGCLPAATDITSREPEERFTTHRAGVARSIAVSPTCGQVVAHQCVSAVRCVASASSSLLLLTRIPCQRTSSFAPAAGNLPAPYTIPCSIFCF
jgi:hypothetical protein